MAALMPVAAAIEAILASLPAPTASETLPLSAALGRVAATACLAAVDVPPADNSAMDGYAIRFADLADFPQGLTLAQRIAAGQQGAALQAGTAARIFTGAEIPPQADTVLLQEQVELREQRLFSLAEVVPGQHIRRRAQDLASGSEVVAAGTVLQAAQLAMLASVGVAELAVFRRLKVALLSSGDELIDPGQKLPPGKIYNSNRPLLAGLLSQLGCDYLDAGRVADSAEASREQLQQLANSDVDLILTTGGVSVGEEDHIKASIEALGQLSLWKLNIKPGKPLAFGRIADVPILALPGNPSSAFVTFALMVIPALRRLSGRPLQDCQASVRQLPAAFSVSRAGRRDEYLRARIELDQQRREVVTIYPNQSSGVLSSVAWANALVAVPAATTVAPGDSVTVLPFSELLSL